MCKRYVKDIKVKFSVKPVRTGLQSTFFGPYADIILVKLCQQKIPASEL